MKAKSIQRSHCISLSVMLLILFLKKVKKNYPQVFLKKCKYIIKEKKISRFINDDLQIYYDDSNKEASDRFDDSDKETDK